MKDHHFYAAIGLIFLAMMLTAAVISDRDATKADIERSRLLAAKCK